MCGPQLGEDVIITVIGSRVNLSFISVNAMSIGSLMVFNVIVGMQKPVIIVHLCERGGSFIVPAI